MASRDIYVAKTTFLMTIDGNRFRITAGKTFVRAGHELLKQHEDKFKKVEPQYEVASNRSNGTRRKTEEAPVEVLEPDDLPE